MEDFFDIFLNDHTVFGLFYDHLNSFRQLNGFDHVLLMSYEEMLADPLIAVKKISSFLGYTYNDNQLKQLTEYVSFKNMRSGFTDGDTYANGFKYVMVMVFFG